ncbi:hypothetical protein KC331_g12892 [Hortaea werneckii]|uniref:Uncharacterized protein n=1 Tax=Hortaea werneckii TaxID=91943 RepID=A0A3M7CCW6_HORWE|nr:hypothetical protein KC331_g12892 [Hortaea werneckii]KAI7709423.1 hypothetical protein KC353_g10362 [Hortaea werneckii]RMY49809.1 hypothetical protein D0865_07274 [Hortaea werneckii]
MEKLILRSIMYGADKIPDSWFDKVPGGFYKAKDSAQKKASGKEAEKYGARPRTGSGSSGANSSSRTNERSRRYSTGDPIRGAAPLDGYEGDDGYRSEGMRRQRRKERASSSYDRADEDSYSGDDRRSFRRDHDRVRRRRSFSQEDRYGDYHRHVHPVQSEYVAPQRPPPADGPESARSTFSPVPPPSSNASFNVAPGVPGAPPGYVPYADIYGRGANIAHDRHQNFAPPSGPPQSSNGSANRTWDQGRQPYSPPVSPPHAGYRQDPYAQTHSSFVAEETQRGFHVGGSRWPQESHLYTEPRHSPASRQHEHHTRGEQDTATFGAALHRGDDRYTEFDERGRAKDMSPPRNKTEEVMPFEARSKYATPPSSWTAKNGSLSNLANLSSQTQSGMYTVDPRHPLTGQLRADQAVGVGPGKGVPANRRKGDSHRHRSQGPNGTHPQRRDSAGYYSD